MAAQRVLDYAEALGQMDEALQQKSRLGIMSCAAAAGEISFTDLKHTLQLTDGNLSTHLYFLEKKGYIGITKGFEGKKPCTRVHPTARGLGALEEYIAALEKLILAHRQTGAK